LRETVISFTQPKLTRHFLIRRRDTLNGHHFKVWIDLFPEHPFDRHQRS
jgi:hypothetical protein